MDFMLYMNAKSFFFGTSNPEMDILYDEFHTQFVFDPMYVIVNIALITLYHKKIREDSQSSKVNVKMKLYPSLGMIFIDEPNRIQPFVRKILKHSNRDLGILRQYIATALIWIPPNKNASVKSIYQIAMKGLMQLKQTYGGLTGQGLEKDIELIADCLSDQDTSNPILLDKSLILNQEVQVDGRKLKIKDCLVEDVGVIESEFQKRVATRHKTSTESQLNACFKEKLQPYFDRLFKTNNQSSTVGDYLKKEIIKAWDDETLIIANSLLTANVHQPSNNIATLETLLNGMSQNFRKVQDELKPHFFKSTSSKTIENERGDGDYYFIEAINQSENDSDSSVEDMDDRPLD